VKSGRESEEGIEVKIKVKKEAVKSMESKRATVNVVVEKNKVLGEKSLAPGIFTVTLGEI
jgi:hypothetical protein